MCTGLVTVAPFFGSMKNTFAFAGCGLLHRLRAGKNTEPGDHHENREHELLLIFINAISFSRSHSSRTAVPTPARTRRRHQEPNRPNHRRCGLRRPVAGSSVSTRSATARANASSAETATSAIRRAAATPRASAPTATTSSRGQPRAGVLEQQDRRIERDRAAKPHAQPSGGVELRHRPLPRRFGQARLHAPASRRARAPRRAAVRSRA